NLLTAVAGKKQTDNKPHDAINRIGEALERVHQAKLFGTLCDVKIVTFLGKAPGLRHRARCKHTSAAPAGFTGIGVAFFIPTRNGPIPGSSTTLPRSIPWNSTRRSTVGGRSAP